MHSGPWCTCKQCFGLLKMELLENSLQGKDIQKLNFWETEILGNDVDTHIRFLINSYQSMWHHWQIWAKSMILWVDVICRERYIEMRKWEETKRLLTTLWEVLMFLSVITFVLWDMMQPTNHRGVFRCVGRLWLKRCSEWSTIINRQIIWYYMLLKIKTLIIQVRIHMLPSR